MKPAQPTHSEVSHTDVTNSGVTWADVDAWAARHKYVFGRGRSVSIAFVVNVLAEKLGRPSADVLAEINREVAGSRIGR